MSFIPDCRAKYVKDVAEPFATKGKKKLKENDINPYWYGILMGTDKEFLQGYDYNTIHTINNLFDNLLVYEVDLNRIGLNVMNIDEGIINGKDPYNEDNDERECKSLNDFTDEDLDKLSTETKFFLAMKSILNDYIEMHRDELVTSMIETMNNDIYDCKIEAIKVVEKENK